MFDSILAFLQGDAGTKQYLALFLEYAARSLIVPICGLSSIFVIKFWLNMKTAPIRVKNLIAILTMVGVDFLTYWINFSGFPHSVRFVEALIVLMTSSVVFALFVPGIDQRINHWLDKKLGNDEPEDKPKPEEPSGETKEHVAVVMPTSESLTKEMLKDQLHVFASTLMTAINLIAERTREYNPPDKVDIFINIFYQGTLLDIFCLEIEKLYFAQQRVPMIEKDIVEKFSQSFELGITEADREANKLANVKEAMITTEMKLESLTEIYPYLAAQIIKQQDWMTTRDDVRVYLRNVMKNWTIR